MLTLKDIDIGFLPSPVNRAFRKFCWSFINDRSLIKEKQKLFYTESDRSSETVFRVVDEVYQKQYVSPEWKRVKFEVTDGVIKEMFWDKPLILDVPFLASGKDYTSEFQKHWLRSMAQSGIIDDLLYVFIRNISTSLWVFYHPELDVIAFGYPKWEKKVHLWRKQGGSMGMIKSSDASLDEILDVEISQWFVNTEIGDPKRQFWYTHLLRAHAMFRLFTWARKALIHWNKYNVIATSRWQGKTFLAALIVARELFSQKPWYWGRRYRNIKYFVPDKQNIGEEVMRYIESLLWDLTKKKFNGKPIIEINRKWYIIKCNITGNIFQLVSLYGYGKGGSELGSAQGEGISADVAIIDEAARIPDDFWASFHQRAAFETDTFFLISTINEETPRDHWFYKLLVDGETGVDPRIHSMRVTIDDNELMKSNLSDEEYKVVLESAKAALRSKWDKEFYAKGYCIILEESNVFDSSQYIVSADRNKYADTDLRILGFDLGKLQDTCGLVLLNLKHMEVEEARIVSNARYGTQLEYAEEYKKRFKNMLIIGDRTGVGEAVSEQDVNGIVDCWLKSTGQWELSYNKTHHFWTCNKGKIITTTATAFNQRLFHIPNDLHDLIEQLKNFVKMKSGNGSVILYKGKWKKKDDLVLAMAYAVVYAYLILWLKSREDIENFVKESWFSEIVSYNDDEDYSSYHNRLY